METPLVIRPTCQEFLGTRYYTSRGGYFLRGGRALHRVVWAHANGPIPAGYHVHHADGDVANNRIENLALLPAAEHVGHHTSTPEHRARAIAHLKRGQPIGAALQRTPENRAKHAAAKKAYWAAQPTYDHVCILCAAAYSTHSSTPNYCSVRCHKAGRWRIKNWGRLHKTP